MIHNLCRLIRRSFTSGHIRLFPSSFIQIAKLDYRHQSATLINWHPTVSWGFSHSRSRKQYAAFKWLTDVSRQGRRWVAGSIVCFHLLVCQINLVNEWKTNQRESLERKWVDYGIRSAISLIQEPLKQSRARIYCWLAIIAAGEPEMP